MKYIKSMIIGFLLATCMFLFMGSVDSHTHKAENIKYDWTKIGMIGTLQGQLQWMEAQIRELKEKIEKLENDKADSYHFH